MQIAFKDSILLGVNLTLTIVRFFKMHSLNASLRVILSRTFFARLLQHLSLLFLSTCLFLLSNSIEMLVHEVDFKMESTTKAAFQ